MTTDNYNDNTSAQLPQRSEDNCAGVRCLVTQYPQTPTLLHFGIDSLYLSIKGNLSGQGRESLRVRKEYASDEATKPKAQIHLHGEIFKVHDKGRGMFKYVISNENYFIQLSERKAGSKLPFALVQISSLCLATKGAERAVTQLKAVLERIGTIAEVPKVSRVDLHADLLEIPLFALLTEKDFVTRAKEFCRYSENQLFTGFAFGMGGQISFRAYMKLEEMKKSGRTHHCDIWRQNGWDGQTPVLRLEFQVRREAASGLDCGTFERLQGHKGKMWRYLCHEWLRLIVQDPSETHRERLKTHPVWEFIQNIPGNCKIGERLANPEPSIEAHKRAAIRLVKAGLSGWMACGESNDIEASNAELMKALLGVEDGKSSLLHTVAKKRREFSTVMNSTTALTPEPDDENA